MRKLLTIPFLLFLPLFINAQEDSKPEKKKQKELGIVFSNFDQYGLSYRFGHEKAMWRISLLNVSGTRSEQFNSSNPDSPEYKSIGAGLNLGREYRKKLAEKVELRLGFGINGTFNYSTYEIKQYYPSGDSFEGDAINQTMNLGVNGIFGFNYIINDWILLGAEFMPSVSYFEDISKNKYDNAPSSSSERYGSSFNFNSSAARLSLMVRF